MNTRTSRRDRRATLGLSLFGLSMLMFAASCSLILDADDHRGGTGTADGGANTGDSGTSNTGDGSVTTADSSVPKVPECDTSADCGAPGIVECLDQRCVFCADELSGAHELRNERGLRGPIALSVMPRPTEGPLAFVATLGATVSTPTQLHSFALESPSEATEFAIDAELQTATCPAHTAIQSIGFGLYTETLNMIVLAENADGGMFTYLSLSTTNMQLGPAGYTCRVRSDPDDILFGGALVQRAENELEGLTRERIDDRTILRVTDATYGNGNLTRNLPSDFDAPSMEMVSNAGYVLLRNDSQVALWHGLSVPSNVSTIPAPGIAGSPSLAFVEEETSTSRYLLSFPVGGRVRFIELTCDSRCRAVGESVDFRPAGSSVEQARMVLVDGHPLLLGVERDERGGRTIVLRVLRASRGPFDAPGGGEALVLATVPDGATVHDIQLQLLSGATNRYVAAWHIGTDTTSSVSVQSHNGTCSP